MNCAEPSLRDEVTVGAVTIAIAGSGGKVSGGGQSLWSGGIEIRAQGGRIGPKSLADGTAPG